jgi:hypothetical protein
MSTLLSDLDTAPAAGDGDFVQNILNEMNGAPPPMPPPAVGGSGQGMMNAPNPNSTAGITMDNAPITSHMIGNSHPTPADFTKMMNTHPVAAPQGTMGGMGAAYAPQQPAYVPPPPPKRSWLARSADEFRVAFFVAILVFVFSLPVVNFLFAHYIPSMVKSTGELTWLGLLIKCLMAGITFWVLQRVIVPLLTL